MPRTAVSRKKGRAFLTGLGLLGVVALLSYVALTASQGGLPLASHTYVRAEFANVGDLSPGQDVRQNSVRVGSVKSIDYTPHAAVVTMQLDGDVPVYRNARAAMWDLSALAQKFVELLPGDRTAPPLGDGVIPLAQTESAADVDQLFDVLDPHTRTALGSTLRELGGGVVGASRQLHDFLAAAPNLLGDVQTVAGALSTPDANLAGLLDSGARLSAQFTGRTQQISALVRDAGDTLEAVNVDGGKPLGDTVRLLPGTLTDAQAALDAIDPSLTDLRAAMTFLQPGAKALGAATPDLRGVLTEGVGPLGKVAPVATSASPALDALTKTFADARPLAPKLDTTLAALRQLLDGLGPYAGDLAAFLQDGASLTGDGQGDMHYLRLSLGPINLGGVAGIGKNPANPYPAPGTAANDRATPGVALIPGSPGR